MCAGYPSSGRACCPSFSPRSSIRNLTSSAPKTTDVGRTWRHLGLRDGRAKSETGGVDGSARAPLAYAGECEQTRADEAPRCWLGGCGSTLDADG